VGVAKSSNALESVLIHREARAAINSLIQIATKAQAIAPALAPLLLAALHVRIALARNNANIFFYF
jgi:hypothetical protein